MESICILFFRAVTDGNKREILLEKQSCWVLIMNIKFRKYVIYEMERYPEKCSECPAFTQNQYTCHNDRGLEAGCDLGYMDGDMRDFRGDIRYNGCRIERDNRVRIR